ncbi:MAG: TRAP transporter substrate-binding protein [bacterium]|nr:TRAP transporter substrate-binding protein [bacterium]
MRLSIRFAGYQPPGSIHTKAAQKFGNILSKCLGDTIQFEFDNDITTSGHQAADLLSMVEQGEQTLCYFSSSYLAARVPAFALLDLPFIIKHREQAYALLDGPLGRQLGEQLAAHTGFRILGFWDNGFRHISNRVRPIRQPADCQGLRIRTLFSDMHQRVFHLLGFTPMALDVKDMLPALRSGAVDAQENPLTNLYNFGIHNEHRFITLTGHFFGVALLLCHQASYTAWPDDVRQAVHAAASEATHAQRGYAAAEDEKVLGKLHPERNEIIHLTEAERTRFIQVVAPLIEEQRSALGAELFTYIDRLTA